MPGHPCPPCCPGDSPCQCPLCNDGPDSVCAFKVVIEGMEWEAAYGFHPVTFDRPLFTSCEQCECMDGTYYFLTTNGCAWSAGFLDGERDDRTVPVMPFEPCGLSGSLYLYDDGGTIKLRFVIGGGGNPGIPSSGDRYVWEKSYGATGPDCKSLTDEDLPFVEDNHTDCDATNATCKVTAFSTTIIGRPSSSNTLGDCYSCKCNRESEIPDQFEVTIAGVDTGDPPCTGCSGIDGTYTLTRIPYETPAHVSDEHRACLWFYEFPTPVEVCPNDYVNGVWLKTRFLESIVSVPPEQDDQDRYELLVGFDGFWGPYVTWIHTPGVGPANPLPINEPATHPYPIDCANLIAQALTPPGWPSWCDGRTSSCTVTAV